MKRDFEEFVIKRCEGALLENINYIENERRGSWGTEEMQGEAEAICYKKGFSDALKILSM